MPIAPAAATAGAAATSGTLCPGQRLERRWDMSERGGNKTKSAPKPPMVNKGPKKK